MNQMTQSVYIVFGQCHSFFLSLIIGNKQYCKIEDVLSKLKILRKQCEPACLAVPSEEFEFTTNTLQAHMKTHGKLILKPFVYHTANSRDDVTL